MENTLEIPVMNLRSGDKIIYDGRVYTVMFAALVRGTKVELTLKRSGLSSRMTSEMKIVRSKNETITKVV